tara:strand:- start:70 stop:291 length:222 start_codon:yes stop_codon:yes gene_type:complete
MAKAKPVIGTVILIDHDGRPTTWSIQKPEGEEKEYLFEVFEKTRLMCVTELMEGGTLKLLDADNNLLRECRGF